MSFPQRFEPFVDHIDVKDRLHELIDKIDERSVAALVADHEDGIELASFGDQGYIAVLLQRANFFIVNEVAELDEHYEDVS